MLNQHINFLLDVYINYDHLHPKMIQFVHENLQYFIQLIKITKKKEIISLLFNLILNDDDPILVVGTSSVCNC
jgi:hypothetical protein